MQQLIPSLHLCITDLSGSDRPEELQRRQTLKRHEGYDAGNLNEQGRKEFGLLVSASN